MEKSYATEHRVMEGPVRENNILKYALLFSLFLHLALFLRFSYLVKLQTKKTLKNIDVLYYNIKLQTKKVEAQAKKQSGGKQGLDKNASVLLDKEITPKSQIKDMSKMVDKLAATNKQPTMITDLQVKRKVSVPPLKSEKITNPLYQNYYQVIRTMIKEHAYANYSKLDTGEVYLTFVLLSNGSVKQVQLIEERSSGTSYLKDVGLKSIQESSPFPPFPKDLAYPELSFNVVISFEVEE